MSTHFAGDTALLTGRSLRHITRSLDTIITTTIMPIAFLLLFVFVFGGAIDTGTGSYIDYLLPGILIITVASGVSYTAYRLFGDQQSGIFERFHSMPIARSSVLWVEAQGDYARLHTADGSHLVRVSLATLAERWADAGFVRIHRSYLVQLRLITELKLTGGGYVVAVGKQELPVSRRHTRELKDRLVRAAKQSWSR